MRTIDSGSFRMTVTLINVICYPCNNAPQENESKKNRALKRAAEEKKQREVKEAEIKRFEVQLKLKLREEGVLKEELERNLKYQDYLESVVQNMSKFFPEIPDILNRYKTLRDANIYLLEKQQMDEGSNENTLREFLTFKKSKENQVLNNNNEIADLQVRMEHKQARTNTLQDDIDNAIKEASEKALSLGQILSSASNILDRCEETFRRRHNKPQIDRSSDKLRLDGMSLTEQCLRTMSKLDEIAMFMADFKDIREEYSKDTGAQISYKQKGAATMAGGVSDKESVTRPAIEPATARSGVTKMSS